VVVNNTASSTRLQLRAFNGRTPSGPRYQARRPSPVKRSRVKG